MASTIEEKGAGFANDAADLRERAVRTLASILRHRRIEMDVGLRQFSVFVAYLDCVPLLLGSDEIDVGKGRNARKCAISNCGDGGRYLDGAQ